MDGTSRGLRAIWWYAPSNEVDYASVCWSLEGVYEADLLGLNGSEVNTNYFNSREVICHVNCPGRFRLAMISLFFEPIGEAMCLPKATPGSKIKN